MTRIIIDCQALLKNCLHPFSTNFIIGCHEYLLQNKCEAEWFFIMDRTYVNNESLKRIPSKNILLKKKFLPGWKFWYDVQLPLLTKKHKADLLITTSGIASASTVPQCSWMPDLPESKGSKKNKGYFGFYKKRMQTTLQRSQIIFVCSEKKRQQIIRENDFVKSTIMVVRSTADERYHMLSWTEKENSKVKYAAGKEYFIVAVNGPQQNLINLLKAFSRFKKRQQSNIQLVFVGKDLKMDPGFIEQLATFKYRSDVYIYHNFDEDEIIKLISGAYALVHPFDDDETGTFVLNAFKAQVPVIASGKGSLPEIAANAVLYASLHDFELLASQLMLLFKDESLRKQLIEKGNLQWQQFNRDESMAQLQNAIMQAANKQS